jgi:hypothetical protein
MTVKLEIISDLLKISREEVVLLRILNFFSSRSIPFIISVKGERFIDLFFVLLDSPGKNVEMP